MTTTWPVPAGWVRVNEVGDRLPMGVQALRIRARKEVAAGNPNYRRQGDSEKHPLLIHEDELRRLQALFLAPADQAGEVTSDVAQ